MDAAYAEVGELTGRTGGTAASALEAALERGGAVQQHVIPLERYGVHVLRSGSLDGKSEFIHCADRL